MKRRSMAALTFFAAGIGRGLFAQGSAAGGHVVLLATLKLKPGREKDFIKSVSEIIARVKKEDTGNVRYEFFRVAPGRGAQASDAATYVVYEEWQDQAAAAAHAKWAGPIVQSEWREMTESLGVQRMTPVQPE